MTYENRNAYGDLVSWAPKQKPAATYRGALELAGIDPDHVQACDAGDGFWRIQLITYPGVVYDLLTTGEYQSS